MRRHKQKHAHTRTATRSRAATHHRRRRFRCHQIRDAPTKGSGGRGREPPDVIGGVRLLINRESRTSAPSSVYNQPAARNSEVWQMIIRVGEQRRRSAHGQLQQLSTMATPARGKEDAAKRSGAPKDPARTRQSKSSLQLVFSSSTVLPRGLRISSTRACISAGGGFPSRLTTPSPGSRADAQQPAVDVVEIEPAGTLLANGIVASAGHWCVHCGIGHDLGDLNLDERDAGCRV